MPDILTLPELSSSSPLITYNRVDFPEPDRPVIPTNSPLSTVNERDFSITRGGSPNDLTISAHSIIFTYADPLIISIGESLPAVRAGK